MQVPISLMIRNGLHALTRKFVTEVLVSSLAALLVMAIFPNISRPVHPIARDGGQLTFVEGTSAGGETSETLADFMERVALSHVAGLKTPPAADSQAAMVAASEPSADVGVPIPPRPAAASRHDRSSSSKVHIAASVPKVPPSAPLPPTATEPAGASTPVKAEPLPPLQYGMRLVTHLGNIISVSETHVVEGVASVGDTLSSLVKKL